MPDKRAVALLALALAMVGCAENRASFFIELIKVPDSDCTVGDSEEGWYRTAGYLDLAYRMDYVLFPLLKNQLSPRGNADSLVAETNGIQVEGANIRIWQGGRPQGDAFYSFYQPASSYVPPGDTTPSAFVAIPAQATAALIAYRFPEYASINDVPFAEAAVYRDLVTIGVRMLGTTNGNVEVETPEFFFPVFIGYGFLTWCSPDSADDDTGALCESAEAPTEGPCFIGQDDPIDCRYGLELFSADSLRRFCSI